MKNYNPTTGQYVVYIDHSTSGTGGFTFQSTADPASLANVFQLPIITTKPFLRAYPERKPMGPPAAAPGALEQEYDAMDETLLGSELEKEGITPSTNAFLAMVASEKILAKDWDNPVEDEAWADL